jgi:hypothetical protein
MNKIQLQVQETINNWFDAKNLEIVKSIDKNIELKGLLEPYKNLTDAGVLVSYGDDGCVAFDGEILLAFRGYAEFGHCEKLAESLTSRLFFYFIILYYTILSPFLVLETISKKINNTLNN